MRTFHTLTIIGWGKKNDDDDTPGAPRTGSLANPGVIDVPDWLLSDEPLEELQGK